MFRRMGELLVAAGELTAAELQEIIDEQARVYRPFGRIAASRFQVREEAIWSAWAVQYACYCPRVSVDSEHRDITVLDWISPSEAMERLLLPLRFHDGDLVVVTTTDALRAALQYVDRRNDPRHSIVLWLADDPLQLVEVIGSAYGLPPAEIRLRKRALMPPNEADQPQTDDGASTAA